MLKPGRWAVGSAAAVAPLRVLECDQVPAGVPRGPEYVRAPDSGHQGLGWERLEPACGLEWAGERPGPD